MKSIKFLCTGVLAVTLLFNCGGDKKKEASEEKIKLGTKKEEKSVESNSNDVVITGNDAMQFNKKEIRVKAGKTVKITLRHIGKMGKDVMGHNFVLLKNGVNLTAFGNKAANARDNGYIPESSTQDIIAHTKMLGGGETDVIEFDAPEPGTYEFLCSFPGHYALMKGKFIVE
ncbi:azurin [Hyunsoonleella ulvae]|uniref:azurin n=1 Tax=Hyunsoonleella ulvae TaxID=2799948 RepID=UPI00193A35DF|nr:azurin [Hyunsoonleella ulvae]